VLTLLPFSADPAFADLTLQAAVAWSQGVLQLHYRLEAPEGLLQLPAASGQPQRRHELWQTTCFEAFIGVPGTAPYWEVNLSTSGHWNVYKLADYRTALAQEERVEAITLQQQSRRSNGLLRLELSTQIPLDGILQREERLEGSLTAVLDAGQAGISYWALKHSGTQADFHLRESFCWQS